MFAPDAFDTLYASKETEGKNERKLISLKSSEMIKELKKQMHETNRLAHQSNSKHKRQQFTLYKRHSNTAKTIPNNSSSSNSSNPTSTVITVIAPISASVTTSSSFDSHFGDHSSESKSSETSENGKGGKAKREEWSVADIVRQFREAKSIGEQLIALTRLADNFRMTMIADTLDDRIIMEVIEAGLVDDLLTIIANLSCDSQMLMAIFTTLIDLTSSSEKSKCSQLLLERGIVQAIKWLIPMFVQGRFNIELCDHFTQIVINLSCDQESCLAMVKAGVLESFAPLAFKLFKDYRTATARSMGYTDQTDQTDRTDYTNLNHDCSNSSSTDSTNNFGDGKSESSEANGWINAAHEILVKMSYTFLNFCKESKEENASSFVPLLAILEDFFLLPDKVICDNVAECIDLMVSQGKEGIRLKLITNPKSSLCKRLVENFVPIDDELEDENLELSKVMGAIHALVAEEQEYSIAILKEPQFFPALVAWLNAKSVSVRQAAYLILSNVATDSIEMKQMIIGREGLLMQICTAMECKSKTVRHHAATTFANLFCVHEGDERSEKHVALVKFFLAGKGIKRLCAAIDYGYGKDVELHLLFVAEGILDITNCNKQVVDQFEEFGLFSHLEELRSHETIDIISNAAARIIEKIEDAKEIFEQQDLL